MKELKWSFLLGLFIFSCARAPIEERHQAMRFYAKTSLESLRADTPLDSLLKTLKRLETKPFGDTMVFGQCTVSTERYSGFLSALAANKDQPLALYEVYGKERWGEILLTSYFSPIYEARKSPEGEFTQPLYSLPKDLIEVNFEGFSHEDLLDQELSRGVVGGRIINGPGELKRVIPYFSRYEIDVEEKLKNRGLELAYLRPVDAFVLQIQGSGKIVFPRGEEVDLGYAGQNGHRYFSIGKALLDIIPKEEMSLARIKAYLKTLNQEELYQFLSKNPSYVFFKKMKNKKGLTTFGIEPQPMSTVAIDYRLFPLGAAGLLDYLHPVIKEETTEFTPKKRLVFAHDTGGAIKGPGRADLFWGSGEEAELAAGAMRHSAELFFLAPPECASTERE